LTKKLTDKEFIEKAIEVHGDKYNYSRVKYKNAKTKVKIVCSKHGEFEQSPSSHLQGSNCYKCAQINKSKKQTSTTIEFIRKAKEIHGNKYDYRETKYVDCSTDIKIFCKNHKGSFYQNPSHHLEGHGCALCAGSKKYTTEEFIEKAIEVHGDKYDYKYVDYKGREVIVKIFCKKHKKFFYQKPCHHIRGSGCKDCGKEISIRKQSKSQDDFIKEAIKINGNKYDYSKVKYIKARCPVEIICLKHFSFFQSPDSHLRGQGCPVCCKKGESKVGEFLVKYFKDWKIIAQKKIWSSFKYYLRSRVCDFWLERDDIKVVVEYDGEQHFRPVRFNGMSFEKAKNNFKRTQLKDKLDIQFCKENDIILYRIKYNEDKESSIKNLKNKLLALRS